MRSSGWQFWAKFCIKTCVTNLTLKKFLTRMNFLYHSRTIKRDMVKFLLKKETNLAWKPLSFKIRNRGFFRPFFSSPHKIINAALFKIEDFCNFWNHDFKFDTINLKFLTLIKTMLEYVFHLKHFFLTVIHFKCQAMKVLSLFLVKGWYMYN